MNAEQPLLKIEGISKSFGKIQALKDVSLTIEEGEVVGLVGDNGAGKSTLMKVIAGAYIPDSGEIYINGEQVRFTHPSQAREKGIGIIYQELALAGLLSVTANVYMGKELRKLRVFVDDKRMKKNTEEALKKLKTTVKAVDQPVSTLSGGQQHAVATARYLIGTPPIIIIMDEPTAGLGVVEADKIIKLILETKQRGISVIFISHNLDHVFQVADRIVVLMSGENAGEIERKDFNRSFVVKMMMGVE
jgi:ABC-type sugar transport system ATPase subunit